MPDRPFAMIFAAFADPASFKLVPSRGIELAIPAPEYEHQPGGPGWKDIEEYLDEADRDPQFDRDNDLNLFGQQGHVRDHIYVRVSPSSTLFIIPTCSLSECLLTELSFYFRKRTQYLPHPYR